MKRFLPLIILILAPLSLLSAKPVLAQGMSYDTYIAQPGDGLWTLAEIKVEKATLFPGAVEYTRVMAVNAVKNLEIMANNLDNTNFYLEIGQSYKVLSQTQVNDIVYQISKFETVLAPKQVNAPAPENAAYLIANPTPFPNWQELRLTVNVIPSLQGQTYAAPVPQVETKPSTPAGFPAPDVVNPTPPPYNPVVQGAHTSIIPLADSPLPL